MRGNVGELVHCAQPVVEGLHAQRIHSKAERRMRADKHRITAGKELAHSLDLGAVNALRIRPWRVAQVPLRLHRPGRPETVLSQRLCRKANADSILRHAQDCLSPPLTSALWRGG